MATRYSLRRTLSAVICLITAMSSILTGNNMVYAADGRSDSVSMSLESYPDVDVILTRGITDVNTDSFRADLMKYLTDMGLSQDKIHITAQDGASSQQDGVFDWTGYSAVRSDYYGRKDSNDANGGYALWHKRGGNITITDNEITSDISFTGNWIAESHLISIAKMPDLGDGKEIYKQEISFDYDLNFGDSIIGAGLILNGQRNGDYLDCYVLSINNNANNGNAPWTGHYLYDLAGHKTGALFKARYYLGGVKMTDDGMTYSKPVNQGNGNLHGSYTKIASFQLDKKGTISVLNQDGHIVIDGTTSGKVARLADVTDLATGDYFGFFEETYNHGCSSCGLFKLTDFSIKSDYRITYANVLTNGAYGFTQDHLHYIVDVDDKVDSSMNEPVVDLYTENDNGYDGMHFIAWGNDTNKDFFNKFLSKHTKTDGTSIGFFVDNGDYANCLEQTAKDIYATVQKYQGDNTVVQELAAKLNLNPESMRQDTATGTGKYKNGKWSVKFDPTSIESDLINGAVTKRTGKESSLYETPVIHDNVYEVTGYKDVDSQDGTIVTGTTTNHVLDSYIKHDNPSSINDLECIGTYVVMRGGFLSDTYNSPYNSALAEGESEYKRVRGYTLSNVREQNGVWSLWGPYYFFDIFGDDNVGTDIEDDSDDYVYRNVHTNWGNRASGNGYTVAELNPVRYAYDTGNPNVGDNGIQYEEIFYVLSDEFESSKYPWKFGKFTYDNVESSIVAYKEVPLYVSKKYTLEEYWADNVIYEYDPIMTYNVPQYDWVERDYQYEDSLRIKAFDKTANPGTYDIYFEDTLIKSIYEHRKPVANFNISVDKSGKVTINNLSYDLDQYYSVSSVDDGQTLHGIKNFTWDYRAVSATTWTSGKPTVLDSNNYLVRLTVEDKDGEISTLTKQVSTGDVYVAPVSMFDFTGGDVNISDDGAYIVSKYKSFSLDDQSYDPNGLQITKRYWTVSYLDDGGKSVIIQDSVANPLTHFDKTGHYTYSLIVENSAGLKSVAYSKSIDVVADQNGPSVTVNPVYRSWSTSSVDVTITVTDAESGFDYFKYAINESKSTPADSSTEWIKITDSSLTFTLKEDGQWYVHVIAYDKDGNSTVFKNGSGPAGLYQIDTTKPTIEKLETDYDAVSATVKTVANDHNTVLNKDGSGIVSYAITTSASEDSITAWQSSPNFRLTQYNTYYIWARDAVGLISDPYRLSYANKRVATWNIESGDGGNGSRVGMVNADGTLSPVMESQGGFGAAAQNLKANHICYYLLNSRFGGKASDNEELYVQHEGGGSNGIADYVSSEADNGEMFGSVQKYDVISTDGDAYATAHVESVPAITFDGNGSISGKMDSDIVFISDQAYVLPANAFKHESGSFSGWSLTKDGPVVFSNEQSVTRDELLNIYNDTFGTSYKSGMITLYAVWN